MGQTDFVFCSPAHGRLFAANRGRGLIVGSRGVVIEHNSWVSDQEGEVHQVGLAFVPATPSIPPISAECQAALALYFSALLGPDAEPGAAADGGGM